MAFMNLEKFHKEYEEACLTLNEKKIREYADKWGVFIPDEPNYAEGFWADVCFVVLLSGKATIDKKAIAANWLIDHLYKPDGTKEVTS